MNLQKTVIIVFLLFPFLGLGQVNVSNQRLSDTVGFLPELYPQLVTAFKNELVIPGRIIF